ncbi:helix-turn-helix transcriptional regulator [Staphylococcus lloydii]|uniref:helix-turn-helix domain-containing protein n=1 Tax=Staphylococcus lloydii TaxID=2781774 RepID=UPI002929F87B|nr:helix-turn-helix transcriptional regulator [Staphylococcus lloydii]MDU9419360.1 helix-turn-helix transcriptional regulator [Staphylococcus lloydii]
MELISKLIQEDINNNSTLKKLYSEQGTKLDLAIVLVNLRKDIGWSKTQLAKKLSIPRTIIEMIENGDILPTMTFLRLLAYVT